MAHRKPRVHLSTHDVTNQATALENVNLFTADRMLLDSCAWSGADVHSERLAEFGARAGAAETQEWCAQANAHPPVLRAFDRFGRRIDEVTYHPAYHELMRLGLEAGVAGAAWNVEQAGHRLHAALMLLMGEADYGVCCPMSMSYAVRPALAVEPSVDEVWGGPVSVEAYDPRCVPAREKRAITMGMAMTEKQGGSDVRANTTRATRDSDGTYRLRGHKWFCSAPMSDAFLTLAHADGGLTCFLVPRWRPDGERNPMEIQRLKDKLGDRSNASSEIEYRHAWAVRVGDEGRGVRTIIEMVQLTRFDCVIGATAQMRQALALAAHHVHGRSAFQERLIDQPLMRAVLADLALDVEAALALTFRLGTALDAAADDPNEAALARVGLPVAKYLTTKRAPTVVVEALECLGGAGFVEESPMPRIFRQSPLNAIWEGSGNVIALDVMRALAREPRAREALTGELRAATSQSPAMAALVDEVDRLLDTSPGEAAARHVVERLGIALSAAVLARHAPPGVSDAFLARRGAAGSLTFGASASAIDEALLIRRATLD